MRALCDVVTALPAPVLTASPALAPIDFFVTAARALCRAEESRLAPPADTPRVTSPRARFSPTRSIVIGDSQSLGLADSGRLPCRVEDHRGERIAYFTSLISSHPELVAGRELVVLQAGGNDVSSGADASTIIAEYERLFATVRRVNPRVTIVLSTIPVRGQWLDALEDLAAARTAEATLDAVNAWIRAHDGFEVFDVNAIVADPDSPRLQREEFRRGDPHDVHFNGAGYRAIGRALRERYFG